DGEASSRPDCAAPCGPSHRRSFDRLRDPRCVQGPRQRRYVTCATLGRMSEDGKKKLKDLAKQVREKTAVSGSTALHEKGLAIVEELAKELMGPDGMPGLKLYRDNAQ